MSQKIGISRQAYQELDFICSQSGASVDQLKAGIKTLTSQMQSAENGGKGATDTFKKLGLSWEDNTGALKDQETMMWEAFTALQGVENQTEKAAMANALFGKAGTELLPMLNGASGSIEEMKAKAHELGLVMSDEAINSGVQFTDTMDQLKRSFGAVFTQIGVNLMPMFQTMAEWVLENMPLIQDTMQVVFGVIEQVVNTAILIIQALAPAVSVAFDFIINLWEVSLKPVLFGIIDFITGVFSGDWEKAWQGISKILEGIFNGLAEFLKIPINAIIKMINSMIGGLNKIKLPDWVPGLGGNGINIPEIPLLAKGGTVYSAGKAIVGEVGPELLELPVGARVTPLRSSDNTSTTHDDTLIDEIRGLRGDILKLAKALMDTSIEIDGRKFGRLVKEYA